MEDSTNFMLAAGCILLVTWYGFHRVPRRRLAVPRKPHDSESSPRIASEDTALLAEFRDATRLVDGLPGGAVECRACGMVYPAGVLYCDCGCETEEIDEREEFFEQFLPHTTSPAVSQPTDSREALICIHVAENYWQATLLKSYLENHSIPCALGGNSSSGPYSFNLGPMSEVRIFVRQSNTSSARDLLHRLAPNQ